MNPALVIVLLGLPVVAAIGWWRLFKLEPNSTVRALLAGFWTVAQFSGGLAVLGWLGQLSLVTALALQGTFSVIVWGVSRRQHVAPSHPVDPAGSRGDRWVLLVVGVIAGLVLLRIGVYAVLLPIDGSDGSSYHLPPLIEALNSGNFAPSDSVVEIGRAGPKTVEMMFLWLMLGRSLDLVLFGQILFLPLGIAAVAALAQWAGVRARLAWAAGVLILFIPVVIAQLTTAYVDVGAGVLLLVAIALTLLYRQGALPARWGTISVYGSLGFAAGSKYSLIVPAIILGLLALAYDIRRRRWGWEHAVGVVLAVLGVGWYFTTLAQYGNPLWPYGIPALDGLFPNYLETVDVIVGREVAYVSELGGLPQWLWPFAVWAEPQNGAFVYSFDSRLAGMGPLWPVVWLPAILAWVLLAIRRRSVGKPLLLVGLFVVFWILQTYPWWTRFTWWLAALGVIAAVKVWQEAPRAVKAGLGTVVVVGAMYALVFSSVQGSWLPERVISLLEGADPVELDAGPTVAFAYHTEHERIAVPGLAWGSWNTYLRGESFDNEVVVISAATAGDLEAGMAASGATMAFVPGDGLSWPDDALFGAAACMKEVSSDVERGQTLYRFTC